MKTAIIIDDEASARRLLRHLLQKWNHQLTILGEADDYFSAVNLIEQTKPDIIFLDISLGEYSGFDILDAVLPTKCAIIFITAYDEFALNGFRYEATDYLLKPIDAQMLETVIRKCIDKEKMALRTQQAKLLKEVVGARKTLKEKIYVAHRKGAELLNIRDIVYVEAQGSYSKIVMIDGREIMTSRILKTFAEEFAEHKNFIRVHRSYLANVNFSKRIGKYDNECMLVFQNQMKIPMLNIDAFKKYFGHR